VSTSKDQQCSLFTSFPRSRMASDFDFQHLPGETGASDACFQLDRLRCVFFAHHHSCFRRTPEFGAHPRSCDTELICSRAASIAIRQGNNDRKQPSGQSVSYALSLTPIRPPCRCGDPQLLPAWRPRPFERDWSCISGQRGSIVTFFIGVCTRVQATAAKEAGPVASWPEGQLGRVGRRQC